MASVSPEIAGTSNSRVEAGQAVSSTGPYAIARHAMYAGPLMMVMGTLLARDSWSGLHLLLLSLPVLARRMLNEEKLW